MTVSKGCPDKTTQIPPHPPAMIFLLPDKIPLAVDFSELIFAALFLTLEVLLFSGLSMLALSVINRMGRQSAALLAQQQQLIFDSACPGPLKRISKSAAREWKNTEEQVSLFGREPSGVFEYFS